MVPDATRGLDKRLMCPHRWLKRPLSYLQPIGAGAGNPPSIWRGGDQRACWIPSWPPGFFPALNRRNATARGDDQSLGSSEEGQFGKNVQLLPFLNTSAGSYICSTKRNLQRRGWGSLPGLGKWAPLQGRAGSSQSPPPFHQRCDLWQVSESTSLSLGFVICEVGRWYPLL